MTCVVLQPTVEEDGASTVARSHKQEDVGFVVGHTVR